MTKKAKHITILGAGMGHAGGLTLEGRAAIEAAEVLIGGSRMIENLPEALKEGKRCVPVWRPEEICEVLEETEAEKIVVLMSGDSGFNSGTTHLLKELRAAGLLWEQTKEADAPGEKPLAGSNEKKRDVCFTYTVLPGVGAISSLAAKAGIGWEEAALISLHGRTQNLYRALMTERKVFVLSGRKTADVMRHLKDSVFYESEVFIGERMGSEAERFFHFPCASSYEEDAFDPMTTMLILPKMNPPHRLLGIPDALFIRGEVPMTKSEVRAVSVSRLMIKTKDVIYDIGAGTGSVSVEAALAAPFGRVYAIEKGKEACALLRKNREKFFCRNMEIIEGTAPEALSDLPAPDAAFLGGTGGRMDEILGVLLKKNPAVRIVINTVSPESLSEAMILLERYGFLHLEISEITIARAKPLGERHIMKGQNPVSVLSATGPGKDGYDSEDAEREGVFDRR